MNLYTCKYNLLTLNNYLNYTYSYYIFPLSRSFLDERQHFFDYFKPINLYVNTQMSIKQYFHFVFNLVCA